MIGFDSILDAPATARYHRDVIEQVIQCVDERVYCALLGPRLCGKTLLLRFIEHNMAGLLGWTCAYIDLLGMRSTTQQAFFADLIRLTAQRLSELSGQELPLPDEKEASSVVFRAFLAESLEKLGRDLVLLIDPLEALPTDLVQALLTSLRAAYMDQQDMDYQVTVVVSGALSLASLTVGESSPFRGIARRVFIGDLSEADSQSLIEEFLAELGVSTTPHAVERLVRATSGDIYLIRWISQRCADLVHARSYSLLRSRDVTYVANRFLRQEVFEYAPLVDAIRLIEGDPDLVECILRLLEQDSVARSALPLPLSPDLDPLYLTGVVEMVEDEHYRLQNLIYRRFLAQHFNPGRVGYVFSMAGRWDAAIDYLEASIQQGDRRSWLDLLPATINSMYASHDLAQAVHFLRRGLSAAFGVHQSQVWFSPPQENQLRLINPTGASKNDGSWEERQMAVTADRLEARAYRQRVPLRGQEGEQQMVRAIPLMTPGSRPVGVVTIFDELVSDIVGEQRERDLQLAGFLNQASRALHAVSTRRMELTLAGRMQASLLPETLPELPGWQIAAAWRPARETSGDFYDIITLPNGRVGIVIADVVDKGMGAALLMALSRTLLRSYAADYPDHPEHLLQAANRRIIADTNAGLFVTLFYGILDPSTGRLSYCNAGHPPPYLLMPGEERPAAVLSRTGMPLGVSNEVTWERESTHIPASGLLLLYTDGITDAVNKEDELYGEGRLLSLVQSNLGRPAREIQEALLNGVYTFAGAEPQVDDITLLVLVREE